MRPAGPEASGPGGAEPPVAPAGPPRPLRPLRIERVGRMGYRQALALQAQRHQAVADGLLDDTLLLLEHDPVITLGKQSSATNVLASPEALARRGVEVVATGRGGDVTYHGPGQLVAYPIVSLQPHERDIKRWVWQLEELVLRTVAHYGVAACRVDGLRGLWVGNDKVAAIGIRLMRWVSCHGLALNVTTDLQDFDQIVPCGLVGRGVTSLARLLQDPPTLSQVEDVLVTHLAAVLHRRPYLAIGEVPALLPAQQKAAMALLV